MFRLTHRQYPWLISGLTLGLDQLSKSLVTIHFVPGQSLPLCPPLVYLTYVQNTGAAFGLLKGQQVLFMLCSVLVIGWIAWELLSKPRLAASVIVGCALVLGGATGNLLDRLRLGYVIDFIDVRVHWPVFNVGDSAITIGVALLLLHALVVSRRRKSLP